MSTTSRGDSFRDLVMSHLVAAGFTTTNEIRAGFKKADGRALWTRDDVDGPVSYLIECKDYSGTLPLTECTTFVSQYGELVRQGPASRAWLISRGPVSPDGRAAIEGQHNLRCFTLQEFQRTLMRLDGYLRDLIARYDEEEIGRYFVAPHTEDGDVLEAEVQRWLAQAQAAPLAVVSGYGKGKSTFAKHLAARMAKEALDDPKVRVPVLIPLGEVLDEISNDSLLGRVFSSRHRAVNYHFHLFVELNRAGRFLIILDGFDEMKHGMTIATFERAFAELMGLDVGDARILILGRNTAFHNDLEFRSIILGKQLTAMGHEVSDPERRPCSTVSLREFTREEVECFVRNFLPICVERRARGKPIDTDWVDARISELLTPRFSEIISRPVHAQMLCQVAADPEVSLEAMTRVHLYDAFVHYLLMREVRKEGRDPALTADIRRKFNAEVAWWLWSKGGAASATLDALPTALCNSAATGVDHGYDATGLKRELAAGLLVEKSRQTIYFAHRSIQEFLVAEHLVQNGLAPANVRRDDPATTLSLLNPEIIDFMVARLRGSDGRERAVTLLDSIDGIRKRVRPGDFELYRHLAELAPDQDERRLESPWRYWLAYQLRTGRSDFGDAGSPYDPITALLGEGFHKDELVEAALILVAQIFKSGSVTANAHAADILAQWIPRRAFAAAIEEASRTKNVIAQVHHTDELALWAFLSTVTVRQGDDELLLDLNLVKLDAICLELTPVGFHDEPTSMNIGNVTLPIQALYRALGRLNFNDREIDKLRPFFSDEWLRSRVRPVMVTRTGFGSGRSNWNKGEALLRSR